MVRVMIFAASRDKAERVVRRRLNNKKLRSPFFGFVINNISFKGRTLNPKVKVYMIEIRRPKKRGKR